MVLRQCVVGMQQVLIKCLLGVVLVIVTVLRVSQTDCCWAPVSAPSPVRPLSPTPHPAERSPRCWGPGRPPLCSCQC